MSTKSGYDYDTEKEEQKRESVPRSMGTRAPRPPPGLEHFANVYSYVPKPKPPKEESTTRGRRRC